MKIDVSGIKMILSSITLHFVNDTIGTLQSFHVAFVNDFKTIIIKREFHKNVTFFLHSPFRKNIYAMTESVSNNFDSSAFNELLHEYYYYSSVSMYYIVFVYV